LERSRYSIDARQTDARRISHGESFQAFQPFDSPAADSSAQQNHSRRDLTLTSASFFADTGICAAVVAMFLAPLIAIALY
jgi:hypothetical protein